MVRPGMDKEPDQTDKPEPSLFDGMADTVAPPPVQHVVPPPAEVPSPEPDPVPVAPALVSEPPAVVVPEPTLVIADDLPPTPAAEHPSVAESAVPAMAVDEPATANPHPTFSMPDVQPASLAEPHPVVAPAVPATVAEEPEPAAAPDVPPTVDAPSPSIHAGDKMDALDEMDDMGAATASLAEGFSPASAAPGEASAVEQPSENELGGPEPADDPVEVASVPPTSPTPRPQPSSGAWWTIPMICVGLMMVACALIVGQVEINRQVAWQRNKLKIDLDYLQKQIKQNEESLKSMQTDPTMAEYLAMRQMGQVREGSAILDVRGLPHQNDRNPFRLTTIPPPKPLLPYQPRGDLLTTLFADQQRALAAIGLGLLLVAAGLVLGGPNEPDEPQQAQ